MDYCFKAVDQLLQIMKLPEFYLIIVDIVSSAAVNVGSYQQCHHATARLYLMCVCVCERERVSKGVQCCAALTCGAVYAAVLSILSVCVWLTAGFSWLPRADVGEMCEGQGEVEAVEKRDDQRVCHFIQAVLILTRILTPVLSISISRWLTKELLCYRQVCIRTVCVCVWFYSIYLSSSCKCKYSVSHKLMPSQLCKISISSQWWSDFHFRLCRVSAQYNTVSRSLLPLDRTLPFTLTYWLDSGHQNADCFPKTWFHKWKNSICFPTASHMVVIAAHMNWSR